MGKLLYLGRETRKNACKWLQLIGNGKAAYIR